MPLQVGKKNKPRSSLHRGGVPRPVACSPQPRVSGIHQWFQKLHTFKRFPLNRFFEKMTHLQNIHFAEALPILHLSCSVASGYGGKYGWTPSDPQTFAKTLMWKNVWSPIKASFCMAISVYPNPTSDRHSPIITGTPTAIAAGQKRWLECALGDFPESRSWATLKGSDGSYSRYKYD